MLELHYGKELADRIRASGCEKQQAVDSVDILEAASPLLQAMQELEVPCYIGGSVASSIQGIPRSTLDLDLVAALGPHHVLHLVDSLQAAYFIDAEMILDAIAHQSSFNVIHLETMFKVDVYVLKSRLFDQEAMRRARTAVLDKANPSRQFRLATPEDVVLHKLEWYRLGGEVSDRQWTDVIGVLKVQAEALDIAYMKHWAEELKIADLLARAFEDSGIPEGS